MTFFVTIVLLLLLGHAFFLVSGIWNVRRLHSKYKTHPILPNQNTNVHVFVPIYKFDKKAENCLIQLLNQRRKPDLVVTIVEAKNTSLVNQLQTYQNEYSYLKVVLAEQATTCSQKNLNLITGIKAYPDSKYYAFCDADVSLPPNWLSDFLYRKENHPEVDIVSSHQTIRNANGFGNFYYMGIHAMMIALGSNPLIKLSGVWAGSYIISKSAFDRAKVLEEWSIHISDDVVLQKLINRKRLTTIFAPEYILLSEPSEMTLIQSLRWFIKQMTFVKLYTPEVWIPLVFNHTLIALSYISLLLIPIFAMIHPDHTLLLLVLAFGIFLHLLSLGLLYLVKKEKDESYTNWIYYMFLGMILVGIVFIITIFKYTILWAGRKYFLKWNGEVKKIVEIN